MKFLEKLFGATPLTIKELFPEFAKHFESANEIKNEISELIYKHEGKLEFGNENGEFTFILKMENENVNIRAIFTDRNSLSIDTIYPTGSIEETKKLSYQQWENIIQSLTSKIETSYTKKRMENIEKRVNNINFYNEINQAKKDVESKYDEYSKLGDYARDKIESRVQFWKKNETQINNMSQVEFENQQKIDVAINKELDLIEAKRKKLEEEIFDLNKFLTSKKVKDFLKND